MRCYALVLLGLSIIVQTSVSQNLTLTGNGTSETVLDPPTESRIHVDVRVKVDISLSSFAYVLAAVGLSFYAMLKVYRLCCLARSKKRSEDRVSLAA
ncbi:hypothetical protein AAVH_19143 [Aphelenchoides avenae]|nr:hypothetical protein AAVH_19143 [Aphelenchus avenae]